MKKAFLLTTVFLAVFWQSASAKKETRNADYIPNTIRDVLRRKHTAATTTRLLKAEALVPSVSIAITIGSRIICAGTSVTFTATPSGVGPLVLYQWKKNGIPVGSTNATYTDAILADRDVITCRMYDRSNSFTTTSSPITMSVNAIVAPTVTIAASPSNTITRGTPVTFTATPTNGGTPVYQWKKNNTHVGTDNATYTDSTLAMNDVITCELTSNAACVSPTIATSPAISMIVTVTPDVTVAASNTIICAGTSVTFTATPINGGTSPSYQWKKNGLNVGSNSATYTDATLATNDGITCELTSNDPNASPTTVVSNPVPMIVNALPIAIISNATLTTFCQEGNVVLNANTAVGLTYRWSRNGTLINGATNAHYTATTAGSYTVVVTDANACTSTSNATVVTVHPLPTATIDYVTPTTFCQGGNVVLNANGGEGLTYQWRRNETALNPTQRSYVATTSGDYSVIVTDANNCTATSDPTTVIVNPMPIPVLSASGSRTFCQGDSVQLQITGGLNYQWSHSTTDSSIWLKQAGLYTVTVTNQWGCNTTLTQQIVVKPLPIVTASASGATTFCQGGQVILNANTGAGLTYQWQRNGTPMLGATNANYTANETGLYTVVVTGLNACSNTSTANSVIVNALPIATITPASVTTFCQGGNVVLNANSGDGLTYRWNQNGTPINGATNAHYTATTAGSYTVVVTNANNCSTTSIANLVVINELPIASIVNTTNILCNGDKSTLTVSGTGGLAPYQYSANGGNYQNSNLFELWAGNHTVNVRDNNGCTSGNRVLTLTQPNVLTITTPTATPLSCYDGFTNLQSTANGGTTPYQYSLTGFGFQNQNQFSVPGGTYQMLVRDANGCRATSSLYNIARPADLGLTTATNPIKCWGDTTHSTIQVANAVAPIQYTMNGVSQNNNLYKGLRMGNYSVGVVDSRGCTKTTTFTIKQPSLLTGNVQVDTMICKGKWTPLVVTAAGGTGNISYRLNAGAFQNNTFMVGAGAQTVQIRDANQCLQTLPTVLVEDATAKMGELRNLKIHCHDMEMRIYPNPVVDILSVDFRISQAGVVKIVVYNAIGDLIAHEDYKKIEAGSYTTSWDTANWASDMVRVCLEVDGVCVEVTSVMIVH